MPVSTPYVTDVKVSGFKKIDKNYVYVIQTTWSDGMKFELYRKYGDFFVFQDVLLKTFPKEAGKNDQRERKIPYLPTMDNVFKLFGRTNSEGIMQQRLSTINYYCKTVLIQIGSHISQSAVTIDFFRPTPNDKQQSRLGRPATLHPQKIPTGNVWEEFVLLADYEAEPGKQQQLSAKANEIVVIMKKDESGWSLCTHKSTGTVGWLPTSFLKKNDDDSGEIELGFAATIAPEEPSTNDSNDDDGPEKYKAICDFTSQDPGQVTFPEGAILIIIDKDDDGWWFVSFNGTEGWAPSSYLEPLTGLPSITADELDEVYVEEDGSDDNTASAITKKTELFYAKRDFEAELDDELSFIKGALIEVVNKSISGWWTGRYNGKTGLVPATFLSCEPINGLEQIETGTSDNHETNPEPTKQDTSCPLLGASLVQTPLTNNKKYDRPPPRRKTVRHVMLQRKSLT